MNSNEGEKTNKYQSVIKSAAAMSMGTLVSRILGLVRDQVMFILFPRFVSDAFVAAFRLPNMFRRLLGEGSLSASFMPIYIDQMQNNGEEKAQEVANSMFSILVVVTSSLSVLGIIFMPELLHLFFSDKGFVEIPGKFELTLILSRIMFGYLFLVTAYAYLMAILNAHKKFFLPAVAPALFNLCLIIFSLFPQAWFAVQGVNLAWGVLAGGVVQAALLVFPLVKIKKLPRFTFNLWSKPVKVVITNMLPSMLGMGVLQILSVVNLYFASQLPEGSLSFIYIGDRILELPQSLIAISMGAALLPSLSGYASRNQLCEMRDYGQNHWLLLLFLALPCSVAIAVIAEPIIQMLFMYREFSKEQAGITAQIVQIYGLMLLTGSLSKVIIPNFYAIKNTWLPAVVSIFGIAVHLFLAPWMMEQWGVLGLVGSTSVSSLLNLFLILLSYRIFIGEIRYLRLSLGCLRFVPGLIAMALVLYFLMLGLRTNLPENQFTGVWGAVALIVLIVSGSLIFLLINHLLKVPEQGEVLGLLQKRRKK